MSKGVVAKRTDERYELVGNQFVTVTIESDDHRVEPITVDAQLLIGAKHDVLVPTGITL